MKLATQERNEIRRELAYARFLALLCIVAAVALPLAAAAIIGRL
jgi:hypothetical protein